MAHSPKALQASLEQYEIQLTQTESALTSCTDEMTKLDLYALQEDLIQLISLTKENLSTLNTTLNKSEDNTIRAESNDSELNCTPEDGYDQDELINLPGSKCQAPYVYNNGSNVITYHNALVLSIEEYADDTKFEDIMVRVMYVNPTCNEMVPCPFFLEGKCKFDSNKCRYSHGELVRFAELKEFREPDFTLIKPNTLVLAKGNDGIWRRAVVNAIADDMKCIVKFESINKGECTLDMHEILPLDDVTDCPTKETNEIDGDEFVSISGRDEQDYYNILVKTNLLTSSSSQRLGEWEKYTKCIGSKLMARMGYVAGTGLGKNATGILQPISATVLPAGKSLDHCMALREASGGDPNLFNVEKLQKKMQEKEAKLLKQQHRHYEKRKAQKNVFSFINKALATTDSSNYLQKSAGNANGSSDISLKDTSERVLNIEKCKVDEDIRKKEKNISHLYLTLSRLTKKSTLYNDVEKKMIRAQNELAHLQKRESNITKEKSFRDTMKQMTTF